MYGKIKKNIMFPIYWHYSYRKKPSFSQYRRYLEESQWYERDKIREIQFQNLKRLLNHAYENVPYYRDKFDKCGFKISKFNDFDDLHKIPALTRPEVKKYYNNKLLAKNIPPTERILNRTSGSTGFPMRFFQDQERNMKNLAIAMRSDTWAGWELGTRKASIWYQHLIVSAADEPQSRNFIRTRLSQIKQRVLHELLGRNNIYIDPNKLSPLQMREQVKRLCKFDPEIILGYVSPVYFIARYMRENGLSGIRPRGMILTSEPIFPRQAEIIEEAFSCPIFVRYAARETGTMAMQCSAHKNLHINAENTYIEILKDGQPAAPSQEGEIVVTDLTNYTMPFIRYNIEDVSAIVQGNCACGRQLPLIRPPMGRSVDMIHTPDGGCLWGGILDFTLGEMNGVKNFQVHQVKLDEIIVRMVKDRNFSEHEFGIAKENLERILGPKVNIEYIFVDDIPLSKSGKFRFIISDLKGM